MAPDRGEKAADEADEPAVSCAPAEKPPPPARLDRRRVVLCLVACLCLWRALYRDVPLVQRERKGAFGLPLHVVRSLGPYTPWYAIERYRPWPSECRVTQVVILQRHGARFPTYAAGEHVRAVVQKLQRAERFLDARYAFLRGFKYDLGADDLVDYGRNEARRSAATTVARYGHLLANDAVWARASICGRVVETAEVWRDHLRTLIDDVRIDGPLVIDDQPWVRASIFCAVDAERAQCNNTLSAHMCLASDATLAMRAAEEWYRVDGLRIATAVNALAPGADLEPNDVPALMSMCAFHSVATQSASPFCALFDAVDFAAFERLASALKYYQTGPGNPLGRVQGVGYVNELVARLAETPLVDATQTNRSLAFPLGRRVYFDATHDTALVAILHALDLVPRDLPSFRAGELCPFAGRLVVERADCSPRHDDAPARQYVRALVNDREVRRWATVADFVRDQRYATSNGDGDWPRCRAGGHAGEVQHDAAI